MRSPSYMSYASVTCNALTNHRDILRIKMPSFSVVNTLAKGPRKQLTVTDGKKSSIYVLVPRFACVGKGDQIRIDPSHPSNVFCVSTDDPNDLIRVAPHYERTESTSLGSLILPLKFTEVNNSSDLDSLTFLEQFHYKSLSSDDDQEDLFAGSRAKAATLGGRRAVLLMYLRVHGVWTAVGYVELQMPLLMCKPRHDLFSQPFEHGRRPISWSIWDQHAIRKYVNHIVRIARVVIHPDFRGLGLSRILLSVTKDFCKTRWQIGGKRPIFLEISAEMLKYVDFVSSSGFKYVGRTEGNASRIVSDLISMSKGYDVTSGIMSLQKKYFTIISKYSKEIGVPIEETLARLQSVVNLDEPAEVLSATEWAAFRKVLRQRLPYYLCALDEESDAYLGPLVRGRAPVRSNANFRVANGAVNLRGLSVRTSFTVPQTKNVRIIMDTFGLSEARVEALVVPPMSVKASAGNITLIVGMSGSGKSALLRALDPDQVSGDSLHVRVGASRSYTAGWLKELPHDIPIFDYFAARYSPEHAFSALSQVGMSEAFALIKPFRMLSRGQQYRTMLADLLLRPEQVWLLDEFCADLDPITARIVAHNFRRHVMSSGRIAFVAAANHAHYLDALRPSQVIQLRTGSDPRLVTYKDYRDELFDQAV